MKMAEKLKFIFVHGLSGWGSYDKAYERIPYWGMRGGDVMAFLRGHGYDCYAASVAPAGSAWDRADIRPGIWNVFPKLDGDHMWPQGGLMRKHDTRGFYLDLVSLITSIRERGRTSSSSVYPDSTEKQEEKILPVLICV